MTDSGTCVTATIHARSRDSQTNSSAIVETASELDGTGGDPKTATGITKTTHGQKGNVTSHGESAFIHKTTNGPWNERATRETGHATPQTTNGHTDAPHENLDLTREKTVKSVSSRLSNLVIP